MSRRCVVPLWRGGRQRPDHVIHSYAYMTSGYMDIEQFYIDEEERHGHIDVHPASPPDYDGGSF